MKNRSKTWPRVLGVITLFAIWLVIGGPATIGPRLSPAASNPLADGAFVIWLTLPLSFVAATLAPSKKWIEAATAHALGWLVIVGFLWGSLPK